MQVICAWCRLEGRPGVLGQREPLDDRSETHGICDRHQQAVLATLASPSCPSLEWLFIVPANDQALYEHMVRLLQGVGGVAVILDRRQSERRQVSMPTATDKRRDERRVRRPERSSLGYSVVRFRVRTSGADPG
jgi:hypothetical protein